MIRLVIVAAFVLTAAAARAQSVPADLSSLAHGQPTVYLLDSAGQEFTGRLLRIDQQSLTLRTALGDLPFVMSNVRTIDRRGDSLKNGAIVGGIIGLVGGLLAAGSGSCDGQLEPSRRCSAAEALGVVAIATAFYGGIGIGIDVLRHGRTRIYPVPKDRAALRIEPLSSRGRTGLNMSLQW